jgi:nucleoside-diphosphate-sugar epimerase
VLGGAQKRPNIHMQDMVDAYLLFLSLPAEKIAGKVFNVGCENHTVQQLAEIVRREVGPSKVTLETVPTNDPRSYHISSEKIARELGFRTKHTIDQAVRDLLEAFKEGLLPNPMTDSRYYNIKRMQEVHLT